MYSWEALFTISTASRSAKFRYSIDGGTTWEELEHEVKDATNDESINLFFPYEVVADGELKLKVQVAKESSGSTMEVKYASAIIERKK